MPRVEYQYVVFFVYSHETNMILIISLKGQTKLYNEFPRPKCFNILNLLTNTLKEINSKSYQQN